MPVPTSFTSKRAFKTAKCDYTENNRQDCRFNVIRLTHSRTCKTVEHSKACNLANPNQRDNSNSSCHCNKFSEEFINNPMANQRQSKIRINNLTVRSNQSSKERTKTDHHKPVRNSGTGEVEHLGVAQNFFQHILKTCTAIIAARWISLALAINPNQLAHPNRQKPQRDNSDQVRKGGQGDTHKARLPITTTIYLEMNQLNSARKADCKRLFPSRRLAMESALGISLGRVELYGMPQP